MKALTQNEVKDNIFKILEMVKNGEDILIKGDVMINKVVCLTP
jgi:hypothetical protein